jgi:hypothetical protein
MRYRKLAKSRRVPKIAAGEGLTLGIPLGGDLTSWVSRGPKGNAFVYPAAALGMHAAVVGGSGSGKTETLLAIAARAAKTYGWKVLFLDCKGDPATQQRFAAAMHQAGVSRIGLFPQNAYDGWRGDERALLNRLLAVIEFNHPYFESVAKLMLDLMLKRPDGAPSSSTEMLKKLHPVSLMNAYRGSAEATDVAGIEQNAGMTTHGRYRSFMSALDGKLDGVWAFEDVDAAYLLLEGTALKDEAASLGRYFLEDFSHYVTKRKRTDDRVLLIVDEYSAISAGTDAANLFERVRSFGGSILVSSQSYSGLGDRRESERILDAAHTLIVHRCPDPERLIQRAGTYRRPERSIYIGREGPTGQGSVRIQDAFKASPDAARQLGVGEVFVIAEGRAHKVQVHPMEVSKPSMKAAGDLLKTVDVEPEPVTVEPAGHLEFA